MQIKVFFTGFFVLLCVALPAQAGPLQELLQSRTMGQVTMEANKLESRLKEKKKIKTKWYDKRSNYGKLFHQAGYPQLLIEWLTSNIGQYKVKRKFAEVTKLRVYAETKLRSPSRNLLVLRVLVPHPKFFDLLDAGMISEFRVLTPIKEELKFTEDIILNGKTTHLYRTKDDKCSLVISTVKRAEINIVQKHCEDFNDMIDLAEMLDVHRLERKLGT